MSTPLSPLGAGIGLRREFQDALLETERELDWLEIISENYMSIGGRVHQLLGRCRERWPMIPHGVGLNIGGEDPLDEVYLDALAELSERLDAPFFSDHLCYNRLGGVYMHELLPLPCTEEVAERVVARIEQARTHVGRPFLLENPTYYAVMPGASRMDEATFLSRIADGADCQILLDINNIYVNSQNHGYDPRAFIDALPLARVAQVHLAGHRVEAVAIIDNHGGAVPEPVWELFRYMLERTGPVSALVEWDQNIPGLDEVLDEADKARAMLAEFA